ncbi:hypothetical protein QIH80_24075 [Bradyrhizobium elkanii]|nr:hypothetical protein QIH80_24075 [Bradyrhizobium elkanii]
MVRQGSRTGRCLRSDPPRAPLSGWRRSRPGLSASCDLVFEGCRSGLGLGAGESRIALHQGPRLAARPVPGIALLRVAADQNDSEAQYNLGYAYESGTGVPKDIQEAAKWYSRASDRGNALARTRLEGLLGGGGILGHLRQLFGGL